MTALLKLFVLIAFGVVGGFLVHLAGGLVDRLLSPECNFFRLASLSLFTTFVVVFGALAFIWPAPGQNDSLPPP
jgi:hypothetical protein